MGHWMTAPEAFGLLVLAAGMLAGLLLCAVWPQPLPRASACLAVAGLLLAAFAMRILMLKTGSRVEPGTDFAAARNFYSLSLAAVPLALGLMRAEKTARAGALPLGLLGAWMFVAWIMPGGESWAAPMELEDRFAAAQAPILRHLAGAGALQDARWLWFAGALLAALPLLLLGWRRTRPRALSGEDEFGLTMLLLGLGVSSCAMSTFYWYAADLSYRDYTTTFIALAAPTAIMLAVTHGRIVSATWLRLGLAFLCALLALWLASGVLGGDFAGGQQSLGNFLPSFLILMLLLLGLPVLGLHGLAAALLAGGRFTLQRLRRRPSAT